MIDDLILFCYEKNIGKKVTLGYAMRMFNAWMRKINRFTDAFSETQVSNKKGTFKAKGKAPGDWFMEERSR